MKPIQVLRWCQETFHHYVFFTCSIFFILGLVMSFKLVETTFIKILMLHLHNAWGKDNFDLRRVVFIVNFLDGTMGVLQPLLVHVTDVYTGRFVMVVLSTAFCIVGLILSLLGAGDNEPLEMSLFLSALGLLALALAAREVSLQMFIEDQLMPTDLDRDRRRQRATFWWNLVSLVTAVSTLLGPLPRLKFKDLAQVLIYVMGVCLLVLMLGTECYNLVARIQNPFKDVGIVVRRAIANRNVECPQALEPRVTWLRWLDRAAEAGSSSCAQVRAVKLFLKMLPLWSCFLTLSIVFGFEITFFLADSISLAAPADDNHLTAVMVLIGLITFTDTAASESSSYVIRKLKESNKYNPLKMELVRIGIGMACCTLCCFASWGNATLRMRGGAISLYWLTPQYFLLGLMMGLSQSGFVALYESQVPESLWRYGMPIVELVAGVGRYVSVLCVLAFRKPPLGWFQKVLEANSLNKYYIFLSVLSVVNFIMYSWAALWYGDDTSLVEEDSLEGSPTRPT